MADVGPLTIVARNAAQAEYLIRSRAQQRAVAVRDLTVEDAGGGAWFVTLTVADADVGEAASLTEDTQVLHLRSRRGS